MSDSTTTIIGNATRAPELRFTPGGMAVANFGVAVNNRKLNKATNEWEEQTSFFDVVCWGSLGEHVSESVEQGTRVVVTGRLEQRSWEDKDGGGKRSKVEVIADEVGPSLRWATAVVTRKKPEANGATRTPARSGAPRPATSDW